MCPCQCSHSLLLPPGVFSELTPSAPGGNGARGWAGRTNGTWLLGAGKSLSHTGACVNATHPLRAWCGCSQDQILLQTDLLTFHLLFGLTGFTWITNLRAPVLCRGCELPTNGWKCSLCWAGFSSILVTLVFDAGLQIKIASSEEQMPVPGVLLLRALSGWSTFELICSKWEILTGITATSLILRCCFPVDCGLKNWIIG